MNGIVVEKKELLTVRDSYGHIVNIGDVVVIRTYRNEDVICTFEGMSSGYILTNTLEGDKENRYRVASISGCRRVENLDIEEWNRRKIEEEE